MSASLPIDVDHLAAVRAIAERFGFDHCGAAPLLLPPRDGAAYADWVRRGFAGGMAYLTDRPEARLNPSETFSGQRSVLTFAVSYFQGPIPPKPTPRHGRVARYAWGEDYHDLLPARLSALLNALQTEANMPLNGVVAVDTKPLLERTFAAAAGLGFIGKNTMTILPRTRHQFHVGSWVFLAEILVDRPLHASIAPPAERRGCGGCTRCLTACPTDAFEGPYVLRANRCISYLTIENKGPIPRDLRRAIGDWVFGCDVCQDVCPFNARARDLRWPEFRAERGVGPWISLRDLLSLRDNGDVRRRFGGTPLTRPRRRGLVRNACVVAGNSGDTGLVPPLNDLLTDAEPLVRGHALWALAQLMERADARCAAESLTRDPDAFVREEAAAVLAS